MDSLITKLKDNDLKVTPKRRGILSIFIRRSKPLTPDEVRSELSKKFRKVSFPSIYRNLDQMEKAGILTRITRPDRRLYYSLCRAGEQVHHHHIICTECGSVGEIKGCGLSGKKYINGHRITGHFLQLEGICPECRK